jgi:DNA-binding transcriptional LysR family regulator
MHNFSHFHESIAWGTRAMTLVQLRHLLALAGSGSFSKSAAALHLTQPALSRSIRALEDELGLRLFDRVGKRSELTPAGRDVIERARHLVHEADELRDVARRMENTSEGVLRIGMGSGPGALLMTPLLMEAATKHPALRVEVSRGSTPLLVQSLRARTLDALVVDARAMAPAPDLSASVLREMRGAFLCRKGHPLTRTKSGVTFDALRKFPVASTPLSDEVARALVARYGPDAHPDLLVSLRCEEIPSLVELAARSNAVLLAIRAAAPALVELRMKPALDTSARFGLVTLRGRSEPPALRIVRALMEGLFRE